MQNLNWVDYIAIAIFFVTILGGLMRGFVKEVLSILVWVVSITVAAFFANPLALKFTGSESVQSAVDQANTTTGVDATQAASLVAVGVSFILIFVIAMIIGSIIGSIISLAFRSDMMGLGNRLLGGVFGIVKGAVITLLLIFLIQLTPFSTQDAWQNSKAVNTSEPIIKWLDAIAAPSLTALKEKANGALDSMSRPQDAAPPPPPVSQENLNNPPPPPQMNTDSDPVT